MRDRDRELNACHRSVVRFDSIENRFIHQAPVDRYLREIRQLYADYKSKINPTDEEHTTFISEFTAREMQIYDTLARLTLRFRFNQAERGLPPSVPDDDKKPPRPE